MRKHHNRSKEKRIRKVSEQALQSEILRNTQKLPEIIPESALFEEDSEIQKKKKKIVLHPRPVYEKEPKTMDEEIKNIWDKNLSVAENYPKLRGNTRPKPKKNFPTSNMAYNSASNVISPPNPSEEQQDQNAVIANEIITETFEEVLHSDGIGDSTIGDVPKVPEVTSKPPEKVSTVSFDIVVDGKIPKSMPDDQKKIKHQALREALRQIQAKEDEKILPEFEKTKEYAKEIQDRKEELASRPKAEKEDKLMKFIADEPNFKIYEQPNSLTELPADDRPFARLQRKFEIERKVGLHESKITE